MFTPLAEVLAHSSGKHMLQGARFQYNAAHVTCSNRAVNNKAKPSLMGKQNASQAGPR
jgi:hypothetical protein